jgi:hypothetical protein
MTRHGSGEPEVHRITAAQRRRSDDMSDRIGRYLLSMLIRTVCFVLMFLTHGPMRWTFAIGAIFLPYVAVIFANASGSRHEAGPAAVRARTPHSLEARSADSDRMRVFQADADADRGVHDETEPDPATPGPREASTGHGGAPAEPGRADRAPPGQGNAPRGQNPQG